MREFWRKERFIEIHTPKFMGSASESGAELFKVEYFDRTAYLAQSPQFYKQMAMAAGFGKVFEIGPVFRANPSFTSRHDTEFTSVDVEISWIDSHEDVMAFEERWLAHVLAVVKDAARRADRRRRSTPSSIVPRAALPARSRSRTPRSCCARPATRRRRPEHDLDPPSERALSAIVDERHGHEFAFVTDYPTIGAALLPHALRRPPDRDQELRPAVAGHRADDRRPARASLRAGCSRRPRTSRSTSARSSTTSTSSASARRRTAASASG